MALHFHRTPIMLSATTLKNLVARYQSYTKIVEFSTTDEETYDKCRTTIALLESGIRQIRDGRERLQKLYNEIRDEYRNCKNKSDKKDIMAEIEQIEDESKIQPTIAEASEIIYMLTARLDESKCAEDRLAIKLGYTTYRTTGSNEPEGSTLSNITLETEGGSGTRPPISVQTEPTTSRPTRRSIKAPQASLPKFNGKAEEFSEFWAVYKTLVHDCDELQVIEKIILLRECLEGRAKTVIQGIQPLPENYDWMVETLHENYCDYTANRSKIIQNLVSLIPASDEAESCSITFENIQVLVNQMVSAGYDVRKTCDPMWCETILAKFPREIVKPVLIASQATANLPIKELLGYLKKEIAAKCYVENRLGHVERRPGYDLANEVNSSHWQNARPNRNEDCIFCHRRHLSTACRTVTDQNSRREILKKENRCWKCFSSQHSSFDCEKADCIRCGQNHHISLCFKKDQIPTTGQNHLRYPSYDREEINARGFDQRNTRAEQSLRPLRNHSGNTSSGLGDYNGFNNHRNFSSNTHMRTEVPQAKEENLATSQLVLMTAEGNLWNFRKQSYEKVLFFFDSGAQKTLIEEDVAHQFGLPKVKTESCTMSGIGGHVEKFESHIVTTKISSAFGEEIKLQIQTKPILTNGFASVKLTDPDTVFLKESNICLANSKLRGEHQTPHILVGLDYYHELVLGPNHTQKTPSGLHIVKTIFGPAVYGKGSTTASHTTCNLSTTSNFWYGMTTSHENGGHNSCDKFKPGMGEQITRSTRCPTEFLQGNERLIFSKGKNSKKERDDVPYNRKPKRKQKRTDQGKSSPQGSWPSNDFHVNRRARRWPSKVNENCVSLQEATRTPRSTTPSEVNYEQHRKGARRPLPPSHSSVIWSPGMPISNLGRLYPNKNVMRTMGSVAKASPHASASNYARK